MVKTNIKLVSQINSWITNKWGLAISKWVNFEVLLYCLCFSPWRLSLEWWKGTLSTLHQMPSLGTCNNFGLLSNQGYPLWHNAGLQKTDGGTGRPFFPNDLKSSIHELKTKIRFFDVSNWKKIRRAPPGTTIEWLLVMCQGILVKRPTMTMRRMKCLERKSSSHFKMETKASTNGVEIKMVNLDPLFLSFSCPCVQNPAENCNKMAASCGIFQDTSFYNSFKQSFCQNFLMPFVMQRANLQKKWMNDCSFFCRKYLDTFIRDSN